MVNSFHNLWDEERLNRKIELSLDYTQKIKELNDKNTINRLLLLIK